MDVFLALFAAALKDPTIRAFMAEEAMKVFAEFYHRRQDDPAFLAASDSTFRQYMTAQTTEDKDAAIKALWALRNSDSHGVLNPPNVQPNGGVVSGS